ncbi:MAG: biopolymer transporter ExbD [Planctomycetota bacterium]|nr:biopolymer transporter ExbD [Planctomycetota bacterium]MEE2894258.1 biopolymer transporter ExbD [Planctomycetota bacterium]
MARRRPPEPASTELNLTSMIDVVFQLLIYFIVGTTFAMGEQSYRMDLPERQGTVEVDPLELDDEPVVVRVLGGGRISVPGPWDGPVSVEGLTDFLRSQRADRGGLIEIDAPIRVKPRGGVSWADAVQAFNAAVAAGYETVGFDESSD